MEQPYKEYKVTSSLDYNKRGLLISLGVGILISIGIFGLFPAPANQFIFTAFGIFVVFISAIAFAVNRFIPAMRIKMYQNRVWIHTANAFLLHPVNNELMLRYTHNGYAASTVVTYDNILSVKKISEQEISELQRINNVPVNVQIKKAPFVNYYSPINKGTQLYLKFICDYNNTVEIIVNELTTLDSGSSEEEILKLAGLNTLKNTLKYFSLSNLPAKKKQEKSVKLLVSTGNADDFIFEITEKRNLMGG